MSDEQDQNRNEWAQFIHGDDFQPPQQQVYVPQGYAAVQGYTPGRHALVQGYAPAETQDWYSDYQDSTASPYSTPQTQETKANAVDDDDTPEEEVRDFVSSRRRKSKSKSQAKPKEEQPKSKRAERREKIAIEHKGEISSTDRPKGRVRWREGVFQWWDSEDKSWRKAAYHDQYRDEFIRQDSAEGTYIVAPDRGRGANDITSACSAYNQLEWRLADRSSWDNIVDADGNKVLYLLDRPVNQTKYEPEMWIHDGHILLDGDNNPVRAWAGIPRCFSSQIEGGRMEALRRILPMTIQDFRARCLRAVPTAATGANTKPLSFPSTFGHRSSRFRAQYQTPAWLSRAASAVLKKQVIDQLPEAEEAATSTEGLQALSRYEVERRKSSTRGIHLYKAAGRAISEEERKERDKKFDEKLERQAARQAQSPQRLQSLPTTPWQSASPITYLPTPPLIAGKKRRREDFGLGDSDVSQSESAAKRGRHSYSPLDPRSEGHFPACLTAADPVQQAPNAYDASSIISTSNSDHVQSESNASGLGLMFGGRDPGSSHTFVPSQNTGVPEIPPQQPEATNSRGIASTNDFQVDNTQVDYRFVGPQNPLEQLRIQAALFYPRAHYYALIGEHPMHTSEGTYADQYLRISSLLAQNWIIEGGLPPLADIGPWYGSFNMVPTPILPNEVLWIILHPDPKASPGPEASATDHHAQLSSANVGTESIPTAPNSISGPEHDGEPNDWSDDLFGEYLEDSQYADGDEE